MKAERRHELQTNSLALWLRWRAPQLWQEHGTKVLLGLLAIVVLVWVIRWRIEAPKTAARVAERDLATAAASIQRMSEGQMRLGESTGIVDTIRQALEQSDSPDIQAKGHALLGDYYVALATTPVPPQATTQPSYRPKLDSKESFAKAREAYEQALKDNPTQGILIAQAHFGLANIAETLAFQADRQAGPKADPAKNPEWSAARQQYQGILDSPAVPKVLKDEAQWRMNQLAQLQKPIWLVPATMPTTLPALPPAELPAAAPATRPAAETSTPAAPLRAPTTAPASK